MNKIVRIDLNKIKCFFFLKMKLYHVNFGYSQVLFMGSVPRINRHLATVLLLQAVIDRDINRQITHLLMF